MRRLFRDFERHGVEALLIGGQASILYGAATFSEDTDVWIRPTAGNVRRFLRALADERALVYKATPRLSVRNLEFGHGFPFTVPRGRDTLFLDVMGVPPRVGSFVEARARATVLRAGRVNVPVVSVADLVELKKTDRFADYDVISNLVADHVRDPLTPRRVLAWAARNSFRAEDRAGILARLRRAASVSACRSRIAADVARLQRRSATYWRRVVADLKRLHRRGALVPLGTPVARLLAQR